MYSCSLCRKPSVVELLDFGPQPVCNRFLRNSDETEQLFSCRIGQCEACGTIQNLDIVPSDELKSRFDWITYNEPEGHLDRLADTLAKLPGLSSDSVISGISYKDDSLLQRMRKRGFGRVWEMNVQRDLGFEKNTVGVESIQAGLTEAAAESITRQRGKSELVIARHIWEHAHNPSAFIKALKHLVTPNGYILLEIPDCERLLRTCDYSMVWEDHVLYFTASTFQSGVVANNLSIRHFVCYPYSSENSLVVIATPNDGHDDENGGGLKFSLVDELQLGRFYKNEYYFYAENVKKQLALFKKTKGKIAILGAGHTACTYINLLGIKDYIDFIVDDNPKKQGLYMPGSRLPILGSTALSDHAVKLCLLSVNADIERLVLEKNRDFEDAGGKFGSIFPSSPLALTL